MKKLMTVFLAAILLLLACFGAFSESVPIDDTLRIGDKNDAVLELQTRLKALLYYKGPLSGEFGNLTQNAIYAVQRAYGLEVTGVADSETLEIIYGECYRPLKLNDTGADVKALQERLKELGYYKAEITGKYLKKTKEAITLFQAEFGMEETGEADVWTQQLLYSDIQRPDATPIPAADVKYSFNGDLAYGSTGPRVQAVQQRLKDLGFFTFYKTTTGYYKNTQQAVKDFQSYNGLYVTGVVNEKTWNALFYDETVVPADGVPKPVGTPEPVPYHLEVDVNNQVVKVWKYNEETQDYTDLDRAFLCSTGTKSNPSELGTYVLTGRRARWCEFPKWGGGKAQYWVRINSDIAFHSVLYSTNNEMSLKVSSLTNLGKRGSHGCVRLTVADAKWIYTNCREGTVVVIHEDGQPDPELLASVQPGELDRSVMLPRTTPAPPEYPKFNSKEIPQWTIRALSKGMTGEDVYWLQMILKEWGYYDGTATGTYLDGTKKAVQAYQRANKLNVTGSADVATMNSIIDRLIALNATPEPTAAPTPSATPVPTETPQPAATDMPIQTPVQTSTPVPEETAVPEPESTQEAE